MRNLTAFSWASVLAILVGCSGASKTTVRDAAAPDNSSHGGSGGAGGGAGTTGKKDADASTATGGSGAGGTSASGGTSAGGTSGSGGGPDARADLSVKSDPIDVGADSPGEDISVERCDVPPAVCQTDGVCGQPCCATQTPYGRHCNGSGGVDYFVCRADVWTKMTEFDVASCAPPFTGSDAGPAPDAGTAANEIVRACAFAASCAGGGSTYSATRCISEFAKTASRQDDSRLNHLLACASRPDCAGFQSCWGGGLFTLEPLMVGAGCSGNILRLFPPAASSSPQWDCTALGGVCFDPATDVQRAGCYAGACTSKSAGSCDGSSAKGCSTGLYTSVDCAPSGRACQLAGQGAVCAGTGAACDTSEKVTCSGSVATYCSRGARATVDCASSGLATRCAAGASPSEPCAVAGTECNPSSFVDPCDNNTLEVCANGFIVPVECSRIGLVLCDASSAGYARCRQ